MSFINPWENKQVQDAKEQQKQEADYQMATNVISSQAEAQDDQNMYEKKEVLVQLSQWQQDRSPAMKKLFLKLSGYHLNPDTNKLSKTKWDKGHVSLYGAHKLINFIEPLDHNVMLANWDDKNLIKTLRDAIAHPLRRYIFQNHKQLGVEMVNAEYVLWNIMNTIEPNYWRGYKDGERRKDKEIIKVHEQRNPYFEGKKKGIFGSEA